ncbi:MAG: hydroxyisourate hydrolase [Planctomycetota bacterium]
MSGITTHVLDTSRGRPAKDVPVLLEFLGEDGWREIGRGETDGDGRLRTVIAPGEKLAAGTYRVTFDTASYFQECGVEGFYPMVIVHFVVRDAAGHYHVPLLLSPYGYSTYRGS